MNRPFKLKYSNSAFPFKSPLHDNDSAKFFKGGEETKTTTRNLNGETETTTTTKSTTSKFRRFFTGKKYKGSGTTRTSTTDPSGKVTRIESSTRWKNR